MKNKDQKFIVEQEFSALGMPVIFWNEKNNANGVDCWVKNKDGKPLSVEVKLCKKKVNGALQVDPVNGHRRKDDLIAIIVNSEYVLIEPMKDHLKLCSPKGTRNLTLMF